MRRADSLGRGISRENPIAVLLIGLCPAAAVSVRVIDALWISAGMIAVMLASCFCMSLVARWGRTPAGEVEAPGGQNATAYGGRGRWWGALVLSSCLTACFEIVLFLVAPEEGAVLGIYVPLIAVNCLVLGRIDAVSRQSSLAGSLRDAAGNGLGFAACLVLIALVREALGAGTITLFAVPGFSGTIAIPSLVNDPARALGYAGGGLLCIGYLAGVARAVSERRAARQPRKESAG